MPVQLTEWFFDRFELFLLGDDEKKVEMKHDTRTSPSLRARHARAAPPSPKPRSENSPTL